MKKYIVSFIEILFLPILYIAALTMRFYRRIGSKRLKLSTKVLKKIGVFPIRDHYYEPLFNDKHLTKDLRKPRDLPGINFNEIMQIKFLKKLNYQVEFTNFIKTNKYKSDIDTFKIENGTFGGGDAEFLFNFIRYLKPSKIIEVGCGSSTKIIQHALVLNEIDQGVLASHICIEPFEQPWLESFPNIKLVRDKIENLDKSIFEELKKGDFLFIDSSHMVRPQGDVLHEYLSIIPSLSKGIFVHIHDIFSPHDYPDNWIKDNVFFWNEQYVLEALLTGNNNLDVVAALNLLKHNHYEELHKVCSYLTPASEPGSFYLKTK